MLFNSHAPACPGIQSSCDLFTGSRNIDKPPVKSQKNGIRDYKCVDPAITLQDDIEC
jgi:hypothetical protein